MKSAIAACLSLALTMPALGQATGCTLEHARYQEPEVGYELQFRPIDPRRDGGSMLLAVFDITRPDRDWSLQGVLSSNMGVNRDEGSAYFECPVDVEDAEITVLSEDCMAWNGVVYALGDQMVGYVGSSEEPAPQTLLLTDFGRQIRYSDVGMGPEDGGWDVFRFVGCAQ